MPGDRSYPHPALSQRSPRGRGSKGARTILIATPEQIREEQRLLRYLRTLVDLTANVIMQSRLSRAESEQLVEATRRRILQLFPGKEETYNIIYRPRFERLIAEFTTDPKVLPFRKPDTIL